MRLQFFLTPLFGEDGGVAYYLGVQVIRLSNDVAYLMAAALYFIETVLLKINYTLIYPIDFLNFSYGRKKRRFAPCVPFIFLDAMSIFQSIYLTIIFLSSRLVLPFLCILMMLSEGILSSSSTDGNVISS